MKRIYSLLLAVALFSSFSAQGLAQEDLDIFGYFQSNFVHAKRTNSDRTLSETNSFAMQQLNIFLNKNLNDNFSTLVNLEFTNSFSSERNWGGLNLEEAWMRYRHSDAFNVKAGLLIPKFNYLNEIKNKTPLLPYVGRPTAYEATLAAALNLEAYIPARAFLQVNGLIPVGDSKFDYAVYVGNSDKAHINGGTSGQRGVDTTTYKLIGGRLGFLTGDLNVGVSGTYDRDNLKSQKIGDVPRTRLGADLSYSIAGFTFQGEFISVVDKLSDLEQKTLDSLAAAPGNVGSKAEKMFYYATLMYNFNPDLYVYGQYNYLEDNSSKSLTNGFQVISFGAGYRPIDQVVLKLQHRILKFSANGATLASTQNAINAGVSVFF